MIPVLNRSRVARFRLPEYRAVILSDSPLAYWRLGDSGSTATEEVSARNGTIGAGVTMGQAGAIARSSNTAALFSPANTSEIRVSSADPFAFGTDPFSVELWAKPSASAAFGASVGRWQSGGGYHWIMYISTSRIQGIVSDGTAASTPAADATGLSLAGAFHHIVFTRAGTSLTLYLDGVSVATGTGLSNIGTSTGKPLAIGNNPDAVNVGVGATFGYAGVLDEVAIYGRSLSVAEVGRHYRAGV